MIVDLNSILVFLVLLTWVFVLSVMLFPDSKADCIERLKEKQEQQCLLQNIVKNLKEINEIETKKIEIQQEPEPEPELEPEPEEVKENENKTETEFFNNDVSTIVPMNASGILYEEQNDAFSHETKNKKLNSLFDERLYNNEYFYDRQFLKPVEYSSKNINSFYDFLASTYNPMNGKYRVNSHGPML